MKTKSSANRIIKFSAVIATAAVAVIAGVIFAQSTNPSKSALRPGMGSQPSNVQYPSPTNPGAGYATSPQPQMQTSVGPVNQLDERGNVVRSYANGGYDYPAHTPPATGLVGGPYTVPNQQPYGQAANNNTGSNFGVGSVPSYGGASIPNAAARPNSNNSSAGGFGSDPNLARRYQGAFEGNFPSNSWGYVPATFPGPQESMISNLLAELTMQPREERSPEKLAELRKLVAEQFDERHQSQSARLERIMAELAQTQEILDRRHSQREQIIDRRVAQLMGQQDPLQWDYQAAEPVYPLVFGPSRIPAGTQIPSTRSLPGNVPQSSFPTGSPQSGTAISGTPIPGTSLSSGLPPSQSSRGSSLSSNSYPSGSLQPPSVKPLKPPAIPTAEVGSSKRIPQLPAPSNAGASGYPPTPPGIGGTEATMPQSQQFLVLGQRLELAQVLRDQARREVSASTSGEAETGSSEVDPSIELELAAVTEQWKFARQQLDEKIAVEKFAVGEAIAAFELAKWEKSHTEALFKIGQASQTDALRAHAAYQQRLAASKRAEMEFKDLENLKLWAEKLQVKLTGDAELTPAEPENAATPIAPAAPQLPSKPEPAPASATPSEPTLAEPTAPAAPADPAEPPAIPIKNNF